jgi:hypothetical protein
MKRRVKTGRASNAGSGAGGGELRRNAEELALLEGR